MHLQSFPITFTIVMYQMFRRHNRRHHRSNSDTTEIATTPPHSMSPTGMTALAGSNAPDKTPDSQFYFTASEGRASPCDTESQYYFSASEVSPSARDSGSTLSIKSPSHGSIMSPKIMSPYGMLLPLGAAIPLDNGSPYFELSDVEEDDDGFFDSVDLPNVDGERELYSPIISQPDNSPVEKEIKSPPLVTNDQNSEDKVRSITIEQNSPDESQRGHVLLNDEQHAVLREVLKGIKPGGKRKSTRKVPGITRLQNLGGDVFNWAEKTAENPWGITYRRKPYPPATPRGSSQLFECARQIRMHHPHRAYRSAKDLITANFGINWFAFEQCNKQALSEFQQDYFDNSQTNRFDNSNGINQVGESVVEDEEAYTIRKYNRICSMRHLTWLLTICNSNIGQLRSLLSCLHIQKIKLAYPKAKMFLFPRLQGQALFVNLRYTNL